ncbi:MAG: MFS transporter [Alphaproteobacteria bacterium]
MEMSAPPDGRPGGGPSSHGGWPEDGAPPDAAAPLPPAQAVEAGHYGGAFRWFLAIQSSWFFCLGMQITLFPYLAADVLEIAPHRLGLAQAALWAPAILLMLPAGALADHVDKRRLLMGLHMLAALPAAGLAVLTGSGWLSYGGLIAYALAQGILGAFANPTRDSLLNHVAESSRVEITVHRAVTAATAAQFIAQLTGMAAALLAAALAPAFGLEPALLVAPLLVSQALVMLLGAAAARRVPGEIRRLNGVSDPGRRLTRAARAIRGGLAEVIRSPVMWPVAAGMLAVGILFVGSFMVVLPTLVRDVHSGGLARFALFTLCFWTGTVPASLFLLRRAPEYPGRALMLSMVWGAGILFLMALHMPFWGMLTLCFLWGAGAGVALTLGRGIMQNAAPGAHRGRVLAIFNLGFAGGAPVGAVLMGYLVNHLGAYTAALFPAAAMLVIAAILIWRSQIWSYSPESE